MKKLNIQKKFFKKNKGLLFVLPWVVFFSVFSVIPIFYSVYMSMTDWGLSGPKEGFIGLENYKTAFGSTDFWHSMKVTVQFAVWAVPLSVLSGLTSALFLNTNVRGLRTFRMLFYIPVISSGVAIAVMWGWILSPDGLLNGFLSIFGIETIYWFNDPTFVIPSYVIIATWGAFSGYLTYLVAIKDIPSNLYDTAKMSGIGYMERLVKITIPLIRPIIIYNLIMAIIASFRKFSEAYILGGAGGQSKFYMVYFYEEAFAYYNMGYAVALAWILVFLVVILIALIYKKTPFWDYYTGGLDED